MSRRPDAATDSVLRGDLLHTRDCVDAVRGQDTIIHLAARGAVSETSAGETARAYRLAVEGTRNLVHAALHEGVRRLVVALPPPTALAVRSGARRDLLVELDVARVRGLDVRTLSHGVPIGAHDVGPSWLGRAMLRYAAGDMRSFAAGAMSLVPATDVGKAAAQLANDDTLQGSAFVLPSALVNVRQLFEMWADEVGPRSRPYERPRLLTATRWGPLHHWVRRHLPEDFDPRLFSDFAPAPRGIRDAVSLPRHDTVGNAIAEAFAWFARHGHVRSARVRSFAS